MWQFQRTIVLGKTKQTNIQEFTCYDTASVEHEVYGHTGNNWSHRNRNRRFKEKFGSHARRTFDRFSAKTDVLGTARIIRKVLQCETKHQPGP